MKGTKQYLNSILWGLGMVIALLFCGLFLNLYIGDGTSGMGDIFILLSPTGFLLGMCLGLLINLWEVCLK